jgi:hypothetical protein
LSPPCIETQFAFREGDDPFDPELSLLGEMAFFLGLPLAFLRRRRFAVTDDVEQHDELMELRATS